MSAASAVAEWRKYWFLPFAAALGYSHAVLHVYSVGPFFAPLTEEFGWTRAQASAGITIAALGGALGCIPIGMLVDRVGPRPVGLVGVTIMCGGVALLSIANGDPMNWLLLWGVIAFGTFGVQSTVWTSAVASRFEASRGLAFAITLSGASFAAAVFPMLTTWLIGEFGWRGGFIGLGGIWFAVAFPILFFVFRGSRDKGAGVRAAEPAPIMQQTGMTLAEGLRSPAIYILLLAGLLFSFTAIAVLVHFVPILTDAGAEPLAAAGIASLVGLFSIIGRLGTGVLLDRFPGHLVGAAAFLIPIVGAGALLLDGANPLHQSIAAAAFGLTIGSEVDVIAYLSAKHFGLRNYGALYGVQVMALGLGTAFGPLAAGMVFDHSGSYTPFLMLTIALTAVASVSLLFLAPPRAGALQAQAS
jgi:MFS family permease